MSAQIPIDKLREYIGKNEISKKDKVVIYSGGKEIPEIEELVDNLKGKGFEVEISDDQSKFNDGAFDVVPQMPTLTEEMRNAMYEALKKSIEHYGIESEYKQEKEARNRKNNKFNAQQLKNRSRYLSMSAHCHKCTYRNGKARK